MADLEMSFDTGKDSMAELKGALDSALKEQFPGGMLQSKWEGETLILTGPGASGSIWFDRGELKGEASLKPPASLMKGLIEQKITTALERALALAAS